MKKQDESEEFKAFWSMPSVEFLNEAFRYDPETGKLYWRERPDHHFKKGRCNSVENAAKKWNRAHAGAEASYPSGNGYRRVGLYKKYFYLHRIIWKMTSGQEPDVIDHVNGDRSDNRLSNLRSCSQGENCRNQTRGKGVGVYSAGKFGWYGQVPIGDGRVKSKLFKTKNEAVAWREASASKIGFTNRHLGIENE